MKGFKGRVAVITGAASGFGREFALALAGQGARLVLADVDEKGMQETVALLPAGTEAITGAATCAPRRASTSWPTRPTRASAPPISSSTTPAWRSRVPAWTATSRTGNGSSTST